VVSWVLQKLSLSLQILLRMDSAELELLVDSGLEVQLMVTIKVQVMVHCLVIPHPLLHYVLLLSRFLVGTRKRTGLV
jgi:hypothetical protein